jgi:hypothetical protein
MAFKLKLKYTRESEVKTDCANLRLASRACSNNIKDTCHVTDVTTATQSCKRHGIMSINHSHIWGHVTDQFVYYLITLYQLCTSYGASAGQIIINHDWINGLSGRSLYYYTGGAGFESHSVISYPYWGFRSITQSLQEIAVIVPRLGHGLSISIPFWLLIYPFRFI